MMKMKKVNVEQVWTKKQEEDVQDYDKFKYRAVIANKNEVNLVYYNINFNLILNFQFFKLQTAQPPSLNSHRAVTRP